MRGRTFAAISMMVILICSWSVAAASGASVSFRISDDKVSVALSLHFYQNATALPTLNGTFTDLSAQELTAALQEGVRARSGNFSVSSLSGELVSANGWINTTIQFEIRGASTRKGSLALFNCSWIPFNVSRNLRYGDISYNLIGATYIRPAFERYVDFEKPPLNETIASVSYESGREEVVPMVAVNRAGNATLLDFSKLALPLEKWQTEYNVTEGMTTWTYNPESAVDLKMTVAPREGAEFVSRALYSYNATVSVEGIGRTQGDTISTDASAGFEPLLMLTVVVVTFLVAIVASWTYRSRRRQLLRKRR